MFAFMTAQRHISFGLITKGSRDICFCPFLGGKRRKKQTRDASQSTLSVIYPKKWYTRHGFLVFHLDLNYFCGAKPTVPSEKSETLSSFALADHALGGIIQSVRRRVARHGQRRREHRFQRQLRHKTHSRFHRHGQHGQSEET